MPYVPGHGPRHGAGCMNGRDLQHRAADLGPRQVAITDVLVIPIASIDVTDVPCGDAHSGYTMGVVDMMRGKRYLIPWKRADLQRHIDAVQGILNNTAHNAETGESSDN